MYFEILILGCNPCQIETSVFFFFLFFSFKTKSFTLNCRKTLLRCVCCASSLLFKYSFSDGNGCVSYCWLIYGKAEEKLPLKVIAFSWEVIGKAGHLPMCLYLSVSSSVEILGCAEEKFINHLFLLSVSHLYLLSQCFSHCSLP